jgi:tape measure domain-containing protein
MAKLNDLIVTIGATTRDFDKALGKSMSKLNRFGRNTKRIGKDLTRSLTLPLAGLGVAAIKSAADLEALETSFISLTGGAEQAANMMKNLNEFTAKTPFQIEAVAKSARQLIASGTGIDEVNTQLQFLGDIAATSGSSIDEIAAIFAKVNAKGKVELENLNQLAERGIPIFTALANATGLPADKLGAGRVSVEEFNTVLKSFSEEGGFAAGAMERLSETAAGKFSTALDNLKLAGAELAEDLLPVVKDLIDGFTVFLQRIQAMTPESKKLALQIAAVAAAIGPLLVIVPQFISGLQLARTAFLALNVAMMANPFAIVATGIGLVVGGLILMNSKTEDAVTAIDKLAQANKDLSLEEQKRNIESAIDNQQKLVDLLKAEKEAKDKIAEKFGGKAIKEQKEANAAFEAANEQLHEMQEMLAGVEQKFRDEAAAAAAAATATEQAMQKVQASYMTAMEPLTVEVVEQNVKPSLQKMGEALGGLAQQAQDSLNASMDAAVNFGFQLAGSFEGIFTSMINGTFNFTEAVMGMFKQMMAKALALVAVFALISAFTGGAGGKFAQGVGGLKGFLSTGFGLPMMASGGLFTGASLAMIGEGSGTSNINPEVVAPLDRLQKMMGGTQVQVTGKISGRDILLTSERNAIDRNRVRGF